MSEQEISPSEGVTPEQFARLYDELRRLAHAQMSRERGDHTLQTTALVNEAFVRLTGADGGLARIDPRRFFLAAAQAMRRILIEHARSQGRKKRGGGGAFRRIDLDSVQCMAADEESADETLMLDEAVCRLEQESPDDAQVVRLRFYAGLSIDQTASALGVSSATVERRWRFARAWLWRQLRQDNGDARE